MADQTVPSNPLGQDSIKGGIFFGSNLTPGGVFSNVPNMSAVNPPTTAQTAKVILTLQQVKEDLQAAAALQNGTTTSNVLSPAAANTVLQTFVQLLIDYSDLRNFVFFGSAFTELTYHINFLTQNYPFFAYFAKDEGTGAVNPSNIIGLTYPGGNTTVVHFEFDDVQQAANYTFDLSGKTIWTNFDIEDKNGTHYPITNASFITSTLNIIAATNTPTINVTVSSITTGLINGDVVTIQGVGGNSAANGKHIINNVVVGFLTTTFDLVGIAGSGAYTSGGFIALNRAQITVTGNININNFVEFSPSSGSLFKGLLIAPTLINTNDFTINLDPVQKELIDPNNPTPWPRLPVTNNLATSGTAFDNWIGNPDNMVVSSATDDFSNSENTIFDPGTQPITSGLFGLNLTGANTLDDNATNQLLRRAIPHRLIDELRDTDDKFFSRFVLLAGKFFDSIKVYIDFLQYTKELNYTPFNQLSPEFYRTYAEHYGFDLFDDENVDLAKAIIRTEPGLNYDSQNNAIYNDPNSAKTVQELQNEKQKRLLINLFFLYSTKGTLKCVETLAKLLGSPEGLVVFQEMSYDMNIGQKVVDNEKVKVPTIAYEIDPDFLVNPANVADPVNLPYVYRLKLDNSNVINLRELDGYTDPQGAVESQVIAFGTTVFPYGHFSERSFASLQNNASVSALNGYYLLPLNFPEKYCGITVEYMLPRNAYIKGVGQGFDEVTVHLASLYQAPGIQYTAGVPNPLALTDKFAFPTPQPFLEGIVSNRNITPIPFSGSFTISGTSGITPLFDTITVFVNGSPIGTAFWQSTKKATALAIVNAINFTDSSPDFVAYYKENAGGLSFTITIESAPKDTLSVPSSSLLEVFLDTGIDVTGNVTPNSQTMSDGAGISTIENKQQFIIARMEGQSLVVRIKLKDENNVVAPSDRVAIMQNIFNADGLNHELRLLYRPEGIEVYQDFKYLGLARWLDPMTATAMAYEALTIPYDQILTCLEAKLPDIFAYPNKQVGGPDAPRWWDIMVGLPVNIDIFFKRVAVQEIPSINHPDSLDFGISPSGFDVEKFSFNFVNQAKDISGTYLQNQIAVPCDFRIMSPFPAPFLVTDPPVGPTEIDIILSAYPNNLVTDLTLVSQSYMRDAPVDFVQDVQNFFTLPTGQVITIDSLFQFNGWSYTLHKDYSYDNFNRVFQNYEIFSQQVLTYLSLLPFMELIENRFKVLVSQFIPIVINISRFGRLVRPLEKLKVHYPNIHKICNGQVIGCNALGAFRIVHGSNNEFANLNNNLDVAIGITRFISNATFATPIVITTSAPHGFLVGTTVTIVGVNGNTGANGTFTIAVPTSTTFTLAGSVGSGAYTGGGLASEDLLDFGLFNWVNDNALTAQTTANAITTAFTPNVIATATVNSIELSIDPAWFLANYNQDINDCQLAVITNGNVQVDDISGMSGAYPSIAGPGCFIVTAVNSLAVPPGFLWEYVYYAAEHGLNTYIYFNSEALAPVFIYYNSEN